MINIDTQKLESLIRSELNEIHMMPGCSGGSIDIGRVNGITVKIVCEVDDYAEPIPAKHRCVVRRK